MPKIYDDIATYEVSVCAWRNWRSAIVGVLAVVIFGKKLVPKARYGNLWSFLTNGYHKLQLVKNRKQNYCDTLSRNMKSHIESMNCIETGRRWKWKPRNCLCCFAWRLLDIFEKCTENENFQIFKFTVFTIFFLFKSMKSTKNPQNYILCTLWHNLYTKHR